MEEEGGDGWCHLVEEEGEGWSHCVEEEGEGEIGGATVWRKRGEMGGATLWRKRERGGPTVWRKRERGRLVVPPCGGSMSECSLTCSAVSLAVQCHL